jgi:ABC-type transport system involved in Fe-S cluster assembly fused permease/ATPase subunit
MLIQEAVETLDSRPDHHHHRPRLSTVRNADQIAVLEGSTITEIGTHADLLAGKAFTTGSTAFNSV